MPSLGSSRNPAIRLPHTAPNVLPRYRRPARPPTKRSVRWTTALASGKLNPMSSADSPTSSRIGRALNHNSARVTTIPDSMASALTARAARVAITTCSMLLASAEASPRSVAATKSPCTTINHSAGLTLRRLTKPETSDPAPIPVRMTVRSRANTARNPPSRMVMWRNQRISIPIAEKPIIASDTVVRMVAASRRPVCGTGWRLSLAGAERRWGTVFGPFLARTIAPTPATALKLTARNCVLCRPVSGTSRKSVRKQPTAAPAVLTA